MELSMGHEAETARRHVGTWVAGQMLKQMKAIKTITGFVGWITYVGLLSTMIYLMVHPPCPLRAVQKTELTKVTAFCACQKCCGRWANGITASGHVIMPGDKFCAAPKNIPFGTIIDIPGYGTVPVLDRGGSITDGRLDVYFDEHVLAKNWGVKYLIVTVIDRK